MRILVVHNRYQQAGGEDRVVAQETALLRQHGHTVIEYYRSNQELATLKLWDKVRLPQRVVWAGDTVRELTRIIGREKPHLVHFHNTFLVVSPAVYTACRQARVPVVQTLHNYRLICPSATLFRDGRVCEDCLSRTVPWPGIVHACYRYSRLQTATTALMLTSHRWLKTWHKQVDVYLTPTAFARKKLIQGGLPASKILVKPNFVEPDPGPREVPGQYMLFVGRLSPEKGGRTLLQAWQQLGHIPLKIVGDGPLRDELQATIQTNTMQHVELLGQQSPADVIALMKKAWGLVFPSEWYETFGLVAVEALACGVPVIGSRLGTTAEIVEDRRTGLLFSAGSPEDLAAKVAWSWTHPQEMVKMGQRARREFEAKYTAEKNYRMLIDIYQHVVEGNTF